MTGPQKSRMTLFIAAGIVLAVSSALPIQAEVGVFNSPTMEIAYIINAITEDGEPIGTIWYPFNPIVPYRSILNPQGFDNGDGNPSIQFNLVSRQTIVTWARNSPDGFDVVISRFEDDSWTTPEILAGSLDDELDPQLTIDPATGDVHVVYWVEAETPRVMHRQAPPDLSTWSEPVVVSQPQEIAVRPAVVFHRGALKVTYESHTSGFRQTPRQIVVATRAVEGFSAEVPATTEHAERNWPQIHSDGSRLWVEWIDSDGSMSWMLQSDPGVWTPLEFEVFQTVEERDYEVRNRVKAAVRACP